MRGVDGQLDGVRRNHGASTRQVAAGLGFDLLPDVVCISGQYRAARWDSIALEGTSCLVYADIMQHMRIVRQRYLLICHCRQSRDAFAAMTQIAHRLVDLCFTLMHVILLVLHDSGCECTYVHQHFACAAGRCKSGDRHMHGI